MSESKLCPIPGCGAEMVESRHDDFCNWVLSRQVGACSGALPCNCGQAGILRCEHGDESSPYHQLAKRVAELEPAAETYFMLAEECSIPEGGSLVDFVHALKSDNAALRAQVESQATFYSTPEGGWFAAWEVAIQDRAKLERELAGARSNLYNAESERDALLREKAEREWIKCSERMPEHGQTVAFVVDAKHDDYLKGRVLGGRFDGSKFGGFTVPGLIVGAACWMPLPEPPDCGHPVSTVEVKG